MSFAGPGSRVISAPPQAPALKSPLLAGVWHHVAWHSAEIGCWIVGSVLLASVGSAFKRLQAAASEPARHVACSAADVAPVLAVITFWSNQNGCAHTHLKMF